MIVKTLREPQPPICGIEITILPGEAAELQALLDYAYEYSFRTSAAPGKFPSRAQIGGWANFIGQALKS